MPSHSTPNKGKPAGPGRGNYPHRRKPVEERFWLHVEKTDGCWLWVGSRNPKGYGHMTVETGKQEATSRVSYRIHKGDIPEGMDVCHTCDNPPCVNPAHLFLGNRAANMQDASRKGRLKTNPPQPTKGTQGRIGTANGHAKITEDQVREIRKRYAQGGISQHQLAEETGISRGIINHVLTGRSWQHVK